MDRRWAVLTLFALSCHGLPDSGADYMTGAGAPGSGSDDTPPAGDSPSPGADGGTGEGAAPSAVKFTPTAGGFTLTNGAVTVQYDLGKGRFDVGNALRGAFARADLLSPALTVTSTAGTRSFGAGAHDAPQTFGKGLEVEVTTSAPGAPNLVQTFALYEGHGYALVGARVENDAGVTSRHVAPIVIDDAGTLDAPAGADPRVLDVPYDNDEWVRYDARKLGSADFVGTGYEVGAVYEGASRHGVVVGSVTHDAWKTGFAYQATAGRLRGLEVFGGVTTTDQPAGVWPPGGPTYGHDGTHDVAGQLHGALSGKTVDGPLVFVGIFDDVRAGLAEFGRANAALAPAKAWAGGVPFGWNSWLAYGGQPGLTAAQRSAKLLAAAQYVKDQLVSKGFGQGTDVYINADAGGGGDPATVDAIHALGLKVGTYRTPFVYYGDATTLTQTVPGTNYKYGEILLHSDDDPTNPIKAKGHYVFDPTHPGAQGIIKATMAGVGQNKYDFVKLDFVSLAALEGKHFDPNVKTGTQAYHVGMKLVTDALPPNVFVSLAISPLFPHGYGHARRLSCDIFGQLNDRLAPTYDYFGSTEYLMNAVTFGGWQGGTLYRFGDPDAMAIFGVAGKTALPTAWNAARVIASAAAGTVFFDATDPANSAAVARAAANLTRSELNAVAALGTPFAPLEVGTAYTSAPIPPSKNTNSGSQASDTFVLAQNGATYIATFNYDDQAAATRTIDLARVGLDPQATYKVHDVWAGGDLGPASAKLTVQLAPGEAALLRLSP